MKSARRQHSKGTRVVVHRGLARHLAEVARTSRSSSSGDGAGLALVRVQYSATAEPIGSMPPLPGVRAHTGDVPLSLFLDKLGERLAFERSGVRLYDALLSKFDAFGSWKHGPSRADLEYVRSEEKEHFSLLHEAIRRLGGDPTALTPSADLHAVATKGLSAVLTDPRTTLSQGLEAILMAELVDNDSWRTLADLAASRREHALAEQFERAIQTESEHLFKVRSWLAAALGSAAEAAASKRAPAPTSKRKPRVVRKRARAKATPTRRSKSARRITKSVKKPRRSGQRKRRSRG